MILTHFTPTIWKEAKLIFIPKPGKPSYNIPKAWRPISLTNYPVKALEKMCVWYTDTKIQQYPLHVNQHGFRTDRSTTTAISAVANYIEQNIYYGKHVLATFLDIQAAFDTIDPGHIRNALLEKNINNDMVNWYYEYITHRNIITTINDTTVKQTKGMGFPQGGVCSAKFWTIAFNEAINIIINIIY